MTSERATKQIFDPIHGFVKLTPLMQDIMFTWEFNRLYDLHQLGAAYLIYPSAVHKRSEHSIGVSHLAGIMATTLVNDKNIDIQKDPRGVYKLVIELPHSKSSTLITKERFIELCRIAGLVHDIGHGPYSHLYDHHVKPYDEPEHEERGIQILTDMVSKYRLPITTEELEIIKTMIVPPETDQRYLWYYQIVANKVCDIDVDKIDYIQRDCFHTGLGFGGEWSRLLTMCSVQNCPTISHEGASPLETKKIKTIAWSYKLQDEIFQLFASRYRLHKHVCSHHTLKAYEYLIIDILKMARSEAESFTDLTDSVVSCRLHKQYRPIQEKIARKQIPILVGEKKVPATESEDMKHYPRIILDVIIDRVEIGLSSGKENPLYNVPFVSRQNELYLMGKDEMGICMPKMHKEAILRIYTTNPNKIKETKDLWATL